MLFRREVLKQKRRELYGDVILVQPLGYLLYTVIFSVLFLTVCSFLLKQDFARKQVVSGYIVPSIGVTTIKAERGGRLTELHVREGVHVAVGSPLLESLVDVNTSSGYVSQRQVESTESRLSELRSQAHAIVQRYVAEEQRLQSQASNVLREIDGLKRRKALQAEALRYSSARRAKMERLLLDDTVSHIEADQSRAENINQALALETIEQQIISREGVLADARYALEALGPAREREHSQLRQQIAQLEENRASLQAASSYIVRSPVAGLVTAVQGSIGQSLNPNMPIVTIVPNDSELIATLLVPTQAIGFIASGQEVNILVDAFPYQKFGVQRGRLTEISQTPYRPGELDAPITYDQSVYRVKVDLEKPTVTAYDEEVPLKPGMTLQGDIITDRRSLIEWMLDPLFSLRRT